MTALLPCPRTWPSGLAAADATCPPSLWSRYSVATVRVTAANTSNICGPLTAQQPHELGASASMSQMRKRRPREGKSLPRSHFR